MRRIVALTDRSIDRTIDQIQLAVFRSVFEHFTWPRSITQARLVECDVLDGALKAKVQTIFQTLCDQIVTKLTYFWFGGREVYPPELTEVVSRDCDVSPIHQFQPKLVGVLDGIVRYLKGNHLGLNSVRVQMMDAKYVKLNNNH